MDASYRFFANKACKFYPCHEGVEEFNCLFCYCPLYDRKHCPGMPEYPRMGRADIMNGQKRTARLCEKCTFPHVPEHFDTIMQLLKKEELREEEVKVAVLADIHNNHLAFETCVDYALAQGIKQFIFLGDYVSDCPYPQKTMTLLYDLMDKYDCTCIRGNREEYVLRYHNSSEKNWKPGSASGSLLYNYQNLTARDLDFFASLDNHAMVTYGDCPSLTICHGSPRDTKELLFEEAKNTKEILSGLDTDYLICAHTHIQSEWEYGGTRFLNPGSVGVPWYYDGRAQFAILYGDRDGWRSRLIRLSYDIQRVWQEYEESGLYALAPAWARMTYETIRTGVDKSSPVLHRVTELCEGKCTWPDFPEEVWEQAMREVWPELGL